MSTTSLSLYNIEAELLNLMVARESPMRTTLNCQMPTRRKPSRECDIAIRAKVSSDLRLHKIDSIAYYLREFEEREQAASKEADRAKMKERMWALRREKLEKYVHDVMVMTGQPRLEGNTNTLKLAKNPPSVEIAQPELVPDEYLQVTVKLPLVVWLELMRVAGSFEDVVAQSVTSRRSEPMKTEITDALKRKVKCPDCLHNGFHKTTDGNFLPCATCMGAGEVIQGVPGCTLQTNKLRLEVE